MVGSFLGIRIEVTDKCPTLNSRHSRLHEDGQILSFSVLGTESVSHSIWTASLPLNFFHNLSFHGVLFAIVNHRFFTSC